LIDAQMWRALRIAILLVVLVLALGVTWGDRYRTTRWEDSLWIGVFPVSADGRPATDRYIAALEPGHFAAIEAFFEREASAFGVAIERPVKIVAFPQVRESPPELAPGSGALEHGLWSLKARLYAWRQAREAVADIRVFVLYHDPDHAESVPHSLGLQKGLLGIVHAWASHDMTEANNIVIAHEVLHTLGATDKYDPATNLPAFPDGYADPDAAPLHPQIGAEIMAGRTALSPTEAEMPASLADVVVGARTAQEINWLP
jgi:hypothetical protein